MKRSTEIGQFSTALMKFQKSTPRVAKDKTAKVPTKAGGSYEYKYADLSTIWDSIRGIMADNELSVVQSPTSQTGEQALTTLIIHSSGEWVEDTMKLTIVQDSPQGQGSAITYARRYMLCAMLGIVADDDTDAREHQPASQIQKRQLFEAAKKVIPELENDPLGMVRFLTEVVGKHPNRILADEFDDALAAVDTYTAKQIGDQDDQSTT
jgi:hypothetical protein